MADEDDRSGMEPDADVVLDAHVIAADLRTVFMRDPLPETARRHIAAMVAAPLSSIVPIRRFRRRAAVAGALACAGVILSGGLAAADVLPTPIQNGVARLVRPIGVELEDSGRHHHSVDDSGGSTDQGGDQDEVDQGQTDPTPGDANDSDTDGSQAGDQYGSSAHAPGRSGHAPDPSTTAPGQTGTDQGRSATAPGHTDAGGNNKPAVPPGQVDNPGQGAPTGKGKGATTTTTTAG